jgi:hypothetical protein
MYELKYFSGKGRNFFKNLEFVLFFCYNSYNIWKSGDTIKGEI